MKDLRTNSIKSEPSDAFVDRLSEREAQQRAQEEPMKPKSVARSAAIVSIAVVFSRVFGLVREIVFARYFGAGFLYDAFLVAFRVPNLLRDLFAEGALSAAFVKVFTDYLLKKSEVEAWRLASLVLNALAVLLSAVSLLGILFAPLLVQLITYNYFGDPNHYFPPEKIALATTLMRVMFPFILLVGLAALAMGVLNSKGRFGVPASASTAFNIVSIGFGLLLAYWLSDGSWERSTDKQVLPSDPAQWAIIGMAIGTLIGGISQFLVQIPSLIQVGFKFTPQLSFADPGVRRVARLVAPAIIGTSAVQIKVVVDMMVASGIEGGISWLSYSFRLMQFPIGVFGVAIGTAAIPTLSRLASGGDTAKFRDTLSAALKLVFLLTVPSACGLVVLSEPIINLIYQGGEFTAFDANMVAWALAAYSVGLVGYAAIKVLSPSFYAMDDARTPMYISIATIAVHAPVSFGMMFLLSTVGVSAERPNGYGHVGVALATSAVALVNFTALTFFMRRKIGRLNGRDIITAFVRVAIASAVMTAVCYVSYRAVASYFAVENFGVRLLEAFIPIGLGGITFFVMAKLLRISEIEQVVAMLRRKLGR